VYSVIKSITEALGGKNVSHESFEKGEFSVAL